MYMTFDTLILYIEMNRSICRNRWGLLHLESYLKESNSATIFNLKKDVAVYVRRSNQD